MTRLSTIPVSFCCFLFLILNRSCSAGNWINCVPGRNITVCNPDDDGGLSGIGFLVTIIIVLGAALLIVVCGWLCAMMGNFDLFINSRYEGYRRAPINTEEPADSTNSPEEV